MSSKNLASKLNAKIVKKFEYLFGDENLEHDKFLQDEIKKNHGWVTLDFLFNLYPFHQLTTNKDIIVAALKDNKIVEISDDNEKVRRNPAVLRSHKLEEKISTVYVKGFPSNTTFEEIMEYLKPHGEVVNIDRCRWKVNNMFNGSIYATFKDAESAEKFVKSEDTKKFKGNELVRMAQNCYWTKQPYFDVHFLKGQVMHVSGLPSENVSIASLKEFFNKFAPVAYVVYEEGSTEATLRFQSTEENSAVKAMEKINEATKEAGGEILFQEKEIQCRILENEEEQKYWADFAKHKSAKGSQAHISYGGSGKHGKKHRKKSADDGKPNIEKMEKSKVECGDKFEQNVLDLIETTVEYKLAQKGARQATKDLHNGRSKLIILAADSPAEIILHLPLLCEEKNVPYVFIKSRDALGVACGVNRPVTTVSITSAEETVEDQDAAAIFSQTENHPQTLSSKALIHEKINEVQRIASSFEIQWESRRKAIELVSQALKKQRGHHPEIVVLAEQYVKTFSDLTNTLDTVIVAADGRDYNLMVNEALADLSQTITIYKEVTNGGDKTKE